MKLTAQKVPYSSVVGQSVTLHDEQGKVVAQLSILNVDMTRDYKTTAIEIADAVVAAFEGVKS